MNLLVKIVFLVCVIVVAAKPMTEDEKKAKFAEIAGKCKAQEGASDSDVQEIIAHLPPTTRTGQCFNACVMETIGIVKDGRLVVETSVKIAEMSGDATKVKNAEAVGKECQSVGGGERCESALQIMQCIGQASAKLGIDPVKDLH